MSVGFNVFHNFCNFTMIISSWLFMIGHVREIRLAVLTSEDCLEVSIT
jgi:hypothetical protein